MPNQTHPQYDEKIDEWQLMRDTYAGEDAVKREGIRYLPPTGGQIIDGMAEGEIGKQSYDAYKMRAVFPDFVSVGVETLIGIMNAKETVIELPQELEYLRKQANLQGEGLGALVRKIHEEQLITGRAGLLADLPAGTVDSATAQQYIELYTAEKILNWDDGSFNDGFNKLNMVLLDECGYERKDSFNWVKADRVRILSLGELNENSIIGQYMQGTSDSKIADPGSVQLTAPVFRGQTLDVIPFVFVGSKDVATAPDKPPLLGLARLCLQIYRGEADYRHSLYLQGQDTLIIIGGVRSSSAEGMNPSDNTLRVGAGARIDVDIGGDAKYAGIGATGLPEQRLALEADRNQAAVRTGQLLAPGKMSMESGEALKTRVAAQTATLTSVAIAAAGALEQLLRIMAKWQNADPEQVKVIPNLDFTNVMIAGQDIVQLLTAKNLGSPMSYKTIHDILRERGLTKNTFEEEMVLIEKDPAKLTELAAALNAPPQANNPVQSAGGPQETPEKAPVKSNKPKT